MSDELPVYRKVDGKLVPVPGNKRDPNRRYRSVADMEMGNYHCEFTDEEERERDAEEAKWEAEKPLRDAEAKRQQEEFEEFKNSLNYDNRIVAFMDILGWRDAIRRSAIDDELTKKLGLALNSVRMHSKYVESINSMFKYIKENSQAEMTSFSDCVVISVPIDAQAESEIVSHLMIFLQQMLNLGFPVRGAITIGKIIHRPGIVYGPALVRAYELEQEQAKYPRIILDYSLAEHWKKGTLFSYLDGTPIGYQRNWRIDNDGWHFLDHLLHFNNMPGHNINMAILQNKLNQIKNIIDGMPPSIKNDARIIEKYNWLIGYHNAIADEFMGSDAPKIPELPHPPHSSRFLPLG